MGKHYSILYNDLHGKRILKKGGYMCVCNWFTLLYTWNSYNILNKLYFSKFFLKKNQLRKSLKYIFCLITISLRLWFGSSRVRARNLICNKSESDTDGLRTAGMVLPWCLWPLGHNCQSPSQCPAASGPPLASFLGWGPSSAAWSPLHPAQSLPYARHWILRSDEWLAVSRPCLQSPVVRRDS